MTLKEAMDYFDYAEKQGISYDLKDMTEKQVIELAKYMMDSADAAYDSYKESHHEDHEIGGCFVCKDGL
jgi:hypothetical protein